MKNELPVAGDREQHALQAPFRSSQNGDTKGEKADQRQSPPCELASRLTGTPLAKALAAVIELEDDVDPKVRLSQANRRLGACSSAASSWLTSVKMPFPHEFITRHGSVAFRLRFGSHFLPKTKARISHPKGRLWGFAPCCAAKCRRQAPHPYFDSAMRQHPSKLGLCHGRFPRIFHPRGFPARSGHLAAKFASGWRWLCSTTG